MSRPHDMNGNPIMENDSVRLGAEKALCDVVDVLPGSYAVLRWPGGYYTKEQTKNLCRVNQHPVTRTPMSMGR